MCTIKRIRRKVYEYLSVGRLKRQIQDLNNSLEMWKKAAEMYRSIANNAYRRLHNDHAMWVRKNQHLKKKLDFLRAEKTDTLEFNDRRIKASLKACKNISLETLESSKPLFAQTEAEKQSCFNRQLWAENLIRQLPDSHEGRNSWLLNYGVYTEACNIRAKSESHSNLVWSEEVNAYISPTNKED